MKRVVSLLLVLLMLFGLFACAKKPSDDTPEETESESQSTAPEGYDLLEFKLVRPSKSDVHISDALVTLQNVLKEKEIEVTATPDTKSADTPEILIGLTNREESSAAQSELPEGKAFMIRFNESNIVIYAHQNIFLPMAVDYFIQNYLPKISEGFLMVEEGEVYIGGDLTSVDLLSGGTLKYELITSKSAGDSEKLIIDDFKAQFKTATGHEITAATDSKKYDKNAYQILLGMTSYAESTNSINAFGVNEACIQVVGNKIVIFGHGDEMLKKAINQFFALVKAQKGGSNTNLTLTLPRDFVDVNHDSVANVPMAQGATYKKTYASGANCLQMYYTGASETVFADYVNTLKSKGFTLDQENKIGTNRFATLVAEDGLVQVTYRGGNKSLSVIADPLKNRAYVAPEDQPEYTKVTDNTLAVMSLDYAAQATESTPYEAGNGTGLSYVMTLEDGRYIIIDGGYKHDAHGLFNFLKDNNKRSDGKIVIAAWILTHCHDDHIGALQSFSTTYGQRVTIEHFIANTTDASMYSKGYSSYIEEQLPQMIKTLFPDSKLVKPHAGQIMTFCDVVLEFLYTAELTAPSLTQGNNDSLIFRAYIEGQIVLFTGDAEDWTSNEVATMYLGALKCDILQVPHHGAGGLVNLLSDQANPTYTLWSTSQPSFEKRISGVAYGYMSSSAITANKYLVEKIGDPNGTGGKCLVADGKTEIMKFPFKGASTIEYYTPTFTKKY